MYQRPMFSSDALWMKAWCRDTIFRSSTEEKSWAALGDPRAFEEEVMVLEQAAGRAEFRFENGLEYEKAVKDRDREAKQRFWVEDEIRAQCGAIVGGSPALNAAL